MRVTRDELYELVWTEPMQKVAAQFGVSDVYLAEVCSRLNVPRPARGHWARLAAGQTVPRAPLPQPVAGTELEWSRGGGRVRRVPPDLPKPPSRRRAAPKPRAEGTSLHPLVAGVAERFKEGRVGYWMEYYKPRKRRLPDLFVSPDTLERALELLNALCLSLEDRGYPVRVGPRDRSYERPPLDPRVPPRPKQPFWDGWAPSGGTITFLGSVAVGLTLFETTERALVTYIRGKKVRVSEAPRRRSVYDAGQEADILSGRLALRAYSPYSGAPWERTWVEREPGDLAGMLESVIRGLEAAAPEIARLAADAEHQAAIDLRRQEAEWRDYQQREEQRRRDNERRELERRRSEAVTRSREDFRSIVDEWAAACRIATFVQDLNMRLSELPPSESALMAARLESARQLLGSNDALERFRTWSSPDELLAGGARAPKP